MAKALIVERGVSEGCWYGSPRLEGLLDLAVQTQVPLLLWKQIVGDHGNLEAPPWHQGRQEVGTEGQGLLSSKGLALWLRGRCQC